MEEKEGEQGEDKRKKINFKREKKKDRCLFESLCVCLYGCTHFIFNIDRAFKSTSIIREGTEISVALTPSLISGEWANIFFMLLCMPESTLTLRVEVYLYHL